MEENNQIELELVENPFSGLRTKPSKGTTFDKDATFTLGGKEQSIYAYTQAQREDCEIYPTLEKYGCLDKIMRTPQELYGDASQMKDLRGTLEDAAKKEQIWNTIPLDIRNQFNNDPDEFMKNGMEWAEKEMQKQQEMNNENQPKGQTNE